MRQVGHTDPKVTLSIYAQVMYRGEGERERLKAVIEGTDWALATISRCRSRVSSCPWMPPKHARLLGIRPMGAAGFEPATSRV